MQILVLYYSKTGVTKRLAEAVAEGVGHVPGARALLKSASEATRQDFVDSAGIIAGSPSYYGSMAGELKGVLDGLNPVRPKLEGKVGAAFATSWNQTGGKETTILSILQAFLICGMVVGGEPLEANGFYGTACAGDPDARTLRNAERLGKRVAELAKRLHPED
jgi:NAD(P)H dehydrogenase (quinone)